jgi:uncharacterized protein
LAHLVAAFHARAEPEAAVAASRDALAGLWADNTAGLLEHGRGVVDLDEVLEVDALAARYLAGRRLLFDRRITEGRALDGHGDLLADDIFLLDDGPRVLDCIEFDVWLRWGDALADVAFLAMDLERLGRPDLAERFLAAYREHAGDAWPSSLAHHHIAYRAQVRAKVGAIRVTQGDDDAVAEARRLLALARRHLETGAVRLVLVGGLPGTGKSTLAAGLAGKFGATLITSDELRKELAGIRSDQPAPAAFGEGLYREEATAATYAEMLHRTEVAVALGESVVLDASWTAERHRTAARSIADRTATDLVELHCSAPPALTARRIRRRLEVVAIPRTPPPRSPRRWQLPKTPGPPPQSSTPAPVITRHSPRRSRSWNAGRTGPCDQPIRDLRPWQPTRAPWRDEAMTESSAHVVPRVGDLGLRPAVAVAPHAPLEQAARIMRAHDISALVVGEPGGQVSIVTERDLTRAIADARPPETEVAVVASPDPLTVTTDMTVMDLATVMLRHGVRHLVVVGDNRRVVGVVSMRDALTALVQTVTPDTVFVMLQRVQIDAPEIWLG